MKKILKVSAGVLLGAVTMGFSACDVESVLGGLVGGNNNNPDLGPHECVYEETVLKEPTCMEGGESQFTCSCGLSYTQSTPPVDHDYVEHEGKVPTCVEGGWEPYTTCANDGCPASTYVELEIDPNNHNFVDGVCKDCETVQVTLSFRVSDWNPSYYAISGCVCYGEPEIILPSTYVDENGKSWRVGEIAASAFSGCSAKKITLPENLDKISGDAFKECDNLTEIVIPDSVTWIEGYIFFGCDNLTSVTVGKGITQWRASVVDNCTSLMNITVSEQNTALKSVDGVLYSKDGKTLLQYPTAKARGAVVIPNTVEIIGARAFMENEFITSVEIADSVVEIEEFAFSGCCNLTEIIFGTGLKKIGMDAFSYTGFTSFVIPDSVTTVEAWIFNGCENLTSITVGLGMTCIQGNFIWNMPALTSVVFKNPNGWKKCTYSGGFIEDVSSETMSDPKGVIEYLITLRDNHLIREEIEN